MQGCGMVPLTGSVPRCGLGFEQRAPVVMSHLGAEDTGLDLGDVDDDVTGAALQPRREHGRLDDVLAAHGAASGDMSHASPVSPCGDRFLLLSPELGGMSPCGDVGDVRDTLSGGTE